MNPKLANQNILIVSNEPWGDMWFSKHHYANELAKLGASVYFANPPKKWKLKNIFTFKIKKNKIKDNLFELNYANHFPVFIQNSIFSRLNDQLFFLKLKSHIPPEEKLTVWSFDPFRFTLISFYKKLKRIYHIADPYMGNKNDLILAKKANLIVCTNSNYTDYYSKLNNNVIHIQHGISDSEFKVDINVISDIKKKYGDFVILTGSIYSDINLKLINNISKKYKVLLLGVVISNDIEKTEWQLLLDNQNIHYLGIINGLDLKNYIAAAKVCLLCYNYDIPRTGSLKVINYLAQHKPIVTSVGIELEHLENKFIFRAKNNTEFMKYIEQNYNTEGKSFELLDHFLSEINYKNLIQNILLQLNKVD